ncbi:GntR family transcriptional regulator [Streptomyces sp. NPDC051561]|uniref:GntR family transcriptional regulator n=1 Tax=Streptomyces sp. NPDC051561 TaxID=3365658 RepID=UPI0037B86F08
MATLKYEQIAETLRARIAEGEFAPGCLMPSGRDLAEQWNVSRATAIKAMDVLRTDGLVVARAGAGFAVTETPVARPAGNRRSGARIDGGAPFRRLGRPDWRVPPARITNALGLAEGEVALRRMRLLLLPDGSPLTLVTAWFSSDVAEGAPRLTDEGPIAEGTTHYVTRQTGRGPKRGRDITTVRLLSPEEAELLNVNPPAGAAVVLHTAYDAEGRTLVAEEGVTPGRLWETEEDYPMGSEF